MGKSESMDSASLKFDAIIAWINQTGLPYGSEIFGVGAALGIFILRPFFARLVVRVLGNTLQTVSSSLDVQAILESPIRLAFVGLAVSLILSTFPLPPFWEDAGHNAVLSLYTYVFFWVLHGVLPPLCLGVFKVRKLRNRVNEDLQNFFINGVQVLVVVIGAVAILEVWRINVSAFLGGLGLMGMAVALAAKDTVANLFGTLTIFTDNTFHKGDWIETPDVEGIVEVIGLRASKIRTFSKALVNVPNAKLADSPITNWSRMTNRRITMTLGLEYRTTAVQLENILARLRTHLQTDPHVAPKGPVAQMVHLTEFGGSSIDINLYYFTKTTDWEEWRQIRSDHIIAFKKIVEEEGSGFAFPSRSLYLETGEGALQQLNSVK